MPKMEYTDYIEHKVNSPNSCKVLVLGDIHLDSQTPSSRLDDYSVTIIDKLHKVFNICIENNIKIVIQLGDFFNRTSVSQSFLNIVLKTLRKFKENGIDIYGILGNHDLIYDRLDTLDRTAIQTVLLAGLITPLRNLTIDLEPYKVSFVGFHYPEQIISKKEYEIQFGTHLGEKSFCVAHQFFNDSRSMNDNITPEFAKELGYDGYLLGHDHIDYQPVRSKDGGYLLIRPGALSRGTSDIYNLSRGVFVTMLQFTSDGKFGCKTIEVPIAPADEVFKTRAFDKDKSGVEALAILKSKVETLLSKLEEEQASTSDIFSIIDSMELEPEVIKLVTKYLNERGIYRDKNTLRSSDI